MKKNSNTVVDRKKVGQIMQRLNQSSGLLQSLTEVIYQETGKDPSLDQLKGFFKAKDRETEFLKLLAEVQTGYKNIKLDFSEEKEKGLRLFASSIRSGLSEDQYLDEFVTIEKGNVKLDPDTGKKIEERSLITLNKKQLEIIQWLELWTSVMNERPKYLGWRGAIGLPWFIHEKNGKLQIDHDEINSLQS